MCIERIESDERFKINNRRKDLFYTWIYNVGNSFKFRLQFDDVVQIKILLESNTEQRRAKDKRLAVFDWAGRCRGEPPHNDCLALIQ